MREEIGRHMMLGENMTETSEMCKKEKTKKAGSCKGISTPWCGWTPPGPRTERAHSPLSPLFFLLGLPSLPTFSFCPDNRGHGETMQRGKARGLCGSNGAVVWGAERGRWVRGPWSFTEGGQERVMEAFFSWVGEFWWGGCIENQKGLGVVEEVDVRDAGWRGAVEGNTGPGPEGLGVMFFGGLKHFSAWLSLKVIMLSLAKKISDFFCYTHTSLQTREKKTLKLKLD